MEQPELPLHPERRCDMCVHYWPLCRTPGKKESRYGQCTNASAARYPGQHVYIKHRAVLVTPKAATYCPRYQEAADDEEPSTDQEIPLRHLGGNERMGGSDWSPGEGG